jgi:uncharacterized C2H2 Zn-finger protein
MKESNKIQDSQRSIDKMTLRKSGEPLYHPCNRCGKMFPKYGTSQKLCEECKLKAGGKTCFSCSICGEKFKYLNNYKTHLKKTHCAEYSSDKKKSFVKHENKIEMEMKL